MTPSKQPARASTFLKRVRRAALFGFAGVIAGPLALAFVPFILASGFESLPIPKQSLAAVCLAVVLIVVIAIVCYFLFAHIQIILLLGAIGGGVAGVVLGAVEPRRQP